MENQSTKIRKPLSSKEEAELEAIREDEIDTSDIPELTTEDFAKMISYSELMNRKRKTSFSIRLDRDVIDFFKGDHARGHQSRINEVLRRYMETHRNKA